MAKSKLKFEEALSRLEEIVRKLEEGQLALDESLKLFTEGMELSKFCSSKLEEAKKKVEILTKASSGKITTSPFKLDKEVAGADSGGENEEKNT